MKQVDSGFFILIFFFHFFIICVEKENLGKANVTQIENVYQIYAVKFYPLFKPSIHTINLYVYYLIFPDTLFADSYRIIFIQRKVAF